MTRIAVLDPVAAFRRGLSIALTEAGFSVEVPPDLMDYGSPAGRRTAVVSVRTDSALEDIRRAVAANPDLLVVAIIRSVDVRGFRRALSAGAATVTSESSSLEHIVDVVRLAATGFSALPTTVVRGLVGGEGLAPEGCPVSATEAAWIKTLARGSTVTSLAQEAGYSEREMYRSLHQIYDRMGVGSRAEALVTAARWGLID